MNIRQVGHTLATGAVFTVREVSEGAKNDPALAMRMAATSISDTLLKKVNVPIKDSFEQAVVPVVRGGILALNSVRAYSTFKNPESTNLDKFIDIGTVASDLVGFVGGIAVLSGSQYAGLGQKLMGFSYAVDAVTHAYRGLNHAGKRVKLWQSELAAAKEAERQREAQQNQNSHPPQTPQPVDPNRVEISIKGSAKSANEILRGQKQVNFIGNTPILSTAK